MLFGGPDSPLTLRDTVVSANHLGGSPASALEGAGIFTVGFPITLDDTVIDGNSPDQCAGC